MAAPMCSGGCRKPIPSSASPRTSLSRLPKASNSSSIQTTVPRVWKQFYGCPPQRNKEADCAYEFPIVHPDGTLRWIANLGRNQYITTGRPICHYGIASDITERKEWENTLRDSENRLRAFSGQLEQLVQVRTEELTQSHDRFAGSPPS